MIRGSGFCFSMMSDEQNADTRMMSIAAAVAAGVDADQT